MICVFVFITYCFSNKQRVRMENGSLSAIAKTMAIIIIFRIFKLYWKSSGIKIAFNIRQKKIIKMTDFGHAFLARLHFSLWFLYLTKTLLVTLKHCCYQWNVKNKQFNTNWMYLFFGILLAEGISFVQKKCMTFVHMIKLLQNITLMILFPLETSWWK